MPIIMDNIYSDEMSTGTSAWVIIAFVFMAKIGNNFKNYTDTKKFVIKPVRAFLSASCGFSVPLHSRRHNCLYFEDATQRLKGQSHKIFNPRFFLNSTPGSPDSCAKAV
jgi:hypothetical protein